jgi:hypothetical protein
MARVTKVVKFYEPMLVDQNDNYKRIKGGFWAPLESRLKSRKPKDREHPYSGVDYYGEARVGTRPSISYIYVGRLRPAADHPDTYRPNTGITGPLQPANKGDKISEPTFMVPFGKRNTVAVMSPRTGATRVSALSAWTSAMSGTLKTHDRVELVPVVDSKTLAKINGAVGATKLYVRIPDGATIPVTGGGVVGDAIREAASKSVPGTYIDMTWSFGHARATADGRGGLLTATRWLARADWTDRVEVNLQLQDGDDLRTEMHAVFHDSVTLRGAFDLPEGRIPSENVVLRSIAEAIQEFGRRA